MAERDRVWSMPLAELAAQLGSSPQGLSSDAAGARLKQYGPNRIVERQKAAIWIEILKRFRNPLVIVLLLAAAIAGATGDAVSFALIAGVVIMSVLLDFVQERRAETAADKLREQVALMASVLRDGKLQSVPAAELVAGDAIELCAGDLVPADCRLISAGHLFVNQSLLTGESYPAEKSAQPPEQRDDNTVPANALFMGSSVVSGTASALIVRTGRETMLGGIAGSLRSEPPPTAFALGLRDFSLMIVRLTVLLVLFVLLVNLLFHRPVLESFLFALALAVGLTPELLPMIVSVTLAHGALRLAGKQVIVKRLSAIHDLGSMDVLCSDKTGTLTKAAIDMTRVIDLDGADAPAARDAAYLNAYFQTGIKSPLDGAILKTAGSVEGWIKRDEKPFDFERRRTSVIVESNALRRLVVKGAPEDVLKACAFYASGGEIKMLGESERARAQTMLQSFGEQGLRSLGIAWRDAQSPNEALDESDLVFGGFALFLDPPKESAAAALKALEELGVAVKVITGDNEHVTAHVCDAIGLEAGETLTGDAIAALGDDALLAKLRTVNKFCRVTPSQKLRVISAFRRAGNVVGYIGDGINDAPSLHAADVSLSVDGAVDVAKEAASMIMLKNDLDVIVEGVREGRRTFANILKYVMMATSSNFGNMFSMAGGVLFLPFLPMLPAQILLNNLLYDISEIAIPMDEVDADMIFRPRRWDVRFVRRFMFVLGPVSSLFDFVTFALLLYVFKAGEALFHTGWFVESLATQCLVIFVIRTRGRPWKSLPNRWLTIGSTATVLVALLLPYTILGSWLGFVSMPASLLAALAATTALYLVLAEFMKRWFFERYPPDAVSAP